MNKDTDLLLPDLLVDAAGEPIESSHAWEHQRRPQILELFRRHVYGRTPELCGSRSYSVFDQDSQSLGGRAIRKQVALEFTANGKTLRIDLLLFLPPEAISRAVPIFSLLNFNGNHTIHSDPSIALPKSHINPDFLPAEDFRGMRADRYPIQPILARGYGIATAYCGDIDPDFDDSFNNGVHALFDPPAPRSPDAWGSVSAWAWGLSRIMDYLETDEQVDHERVAVLGHSRLGKTALWAGAQDERFAIVISNDSGCTGAAISRGKQGESVKIINQLFPHWFCRNYKNYNDKEAELPVDQHMLLALMAPRPLYVASATEDLWADPASEFKSCIHAAPVYRLFGLNGLKTDQMPDPDQPLLEGHIGYHNRTGEHALTEYDWERFMDFADRY
ncbi:MAG: acetylxylan esterase [Proteobacteria bacterium]|nr:acetylxylan esterase [Pseudomonadota bacterium]